MKVPESLPFSDGYAREAEGLISVSSRVDIGRGFWKESEGFESLILRNYRCQRAL